MKRITIGPFIVDEHLRDRLNDHQRMVGAPHAEIVRRALEAFLATQPRRAGNGDRTPNATPKEMRQGS